MKSFVAVLALAAMATADAATCATSVLSTLLSDPNIDQCGSESGYAFTSGVKPTDAEARALCASSACHALLADTKALGVSECTIPLGDKISLIADLVDYVPKFCSSDSGSTSEAPATSGPAPSGSASTTPTATAAPPAAC